MTSINAATPENSIVPVPELKNSGRIMFSQWDLWTGILPLLAFAPMLTFQAASAWSDPQMRFFPVAWLIGLLIVLFRGRKDEPNLGYWRQWIAIAIFFIAVVLYLFSLWYFSPWLAQFAAILAFLAWGLGRFGQTHWAAVSAWACIFATSLSLPFEWNSQLSQWLRLSAAWCCSKSLDAFSIPNLLLGNLIELRSQQLLADQICSGLGSLNALAALTVIILVLRHRSFLVAVLSILLLPFWMLLSHYLRLMAVAIAAEYWQRDLCIGLDYRLLEATTFLIALLFSWLSIRMLTIVCEPVPVADAEFGPVFWGLNKALTWPQRDPFEDAEPEDPDDRKHFQQMKEMREAAKRNYRKMDWLLQPPAKWSVIGISLILILASIAPMVALARGFGTLRFGIPTLPAATVEQLANSPIPEELDGWKFVNKTRSSSASQDDQGTSTVSWELRSDEQTYVLSVDFPFIGWHDPTRSRAQLGWKIASPNIEPEDGWPVFYTEMENDLGGRSIVFSSMLDSNREILESVSSSADSEEAKQVHLSVFDLIRGEQLDSEKVTIQIQLFCESGDPLKESEKRSMKLQFIKLRQLFLASADAGRDLPATDTPAVPD